MRAFPRTVASILAALTLAAGAAACSRGNLEEPNMTSMSSTADAEADSDGSSEDDSGDAKDDSDDAEDDSDIASESLSESSGSKKNSKKKESSDDGGYSYDRVKDDNGYITNVGLGEAGQKASFPACDGRYILILDSIIATGSDQDTFNRLAQAVMFADPSGKEFTIPGQCDSLRKTYHGNDVYPIYLDFGSDKAAACRTKSTYGGNVRPLIDGDFDDASSQDVDDARMALDPC